MAQLTGEHGWHKGSKHEEQHGEEEAAGVVEDLDGIVTDVQVKETNEHADDHVGHKSQVGQDLSEERGWATGQRWAEHTGVGTQSRPHRHIDPRVPWETAG